ncbi:MAG: hypothetical protein ASARMPRED_008265 [Alectoria sarmentosa]|nr:MAG: hypothetical protein ASARMPRED_008265 [Alectoria sarmentosa]
MSYAPTQKPLMVKANSAADSQILQPPIVHRHRKTVSTGGGRAWSDAEEAYLIETREHKMPYKHIASQLKKTELACRLHYHQLSFGSKSRRISQAPVNAYERSSAPPPAQSRGEAPQRQLPPFSSPASSPETMEYSPSESSCPTPQSHKLILPKPVPSIHRRISDTQSLRLVTQDMDRLQERQHVDMAKLDRIYDAHRLNFWSTIARNYGCNLSLATLEEAWYRAHGLSNSKFPPTPRGSPHETQAPSNILSGAPFSAVTDSSKGFTPINSEASNPKPIIPKQNSCAISSLLTEDRAVRSPGREKKLEDVETRVKREK